MLEHFGLYRLYQFRLRATEELAPESVIKTSVGFIGYKSQFYVGTDVYTQFDGTPTECRVRRVDNPVPNYDVTGDGNVDIDDVNALINHILAK